jgi:hypothetical protein
LPDLRPLSGLRHSVTATVLPSGTKLGMGIATLPAIPTREVKGMAHHQGKTGISDPTYNLVSVLYHALQGAETYDQYIQDAESEGMNDLAQFFRDVQKEERHRADRAKELLHQHLGRSKGGHRAAA